MRVLLDTHAFLWYTLGDPQLSTAADTIIRAPANTILVAPASLWELAIKISIGKIRLHQPFEDFIDACVNRYAFQLLPFAPAHAVRLAALPFPPNHKDPFDRMLVAQALVEQIPVVSNDAVLDAYQIQRLW